MLSITLLLNASLIAERLLVSSLLGCSEEKVASRSDKRIPTVQVGIRRHWANNISYIVLFQRGI